MSTQSSPAHPIRTPILQVLRVVAGRLQDVQIEWAITGSLGFALQGVPVEVHDIDLQTDLRGAYHIEELLSDFIVERVFLRTSELMRSYYGRCEIDEVQVEIIGGLQKRSMAAAWDDPVDIRAHRRWTQFEGSLLPVLSLEYETNAYRMLGRVEKARLLENFLNKTKEK